jgi:cystathionine beta-lyase/cystathionine gamma-synthase
MRSGYEYARGGNPSRNSLEKTLAAAENGKYGRAFASGLAACSAVIGILKPGDEIISTGDIYGGSYRLFTQIYQKYSIKVKFLDTHSSKEIALAVSKDTRLIWLESPTNPLLNIIDIAEAAELKPKNVILAVDNTFASPYFQNPLDLGAEIVVHSTTKYIGGHSDIIGGAVITNDPELDETLRFQQYAVGGVPSPFDCYLTQRGLKTLAVRMERHQFNAFRVSEFLKGRSDVEKVFFPGFPEHPGYAVAKKQMRGLPGVVSFLIKGGREAVDRFFSRLRIFTFAESLGAVESLACYPYLMTHGSIPEDVREKMGISDNLIRLSMGIEDIDDLLEDLGQALGGN